MYNFYFNDQSARVSMTALESQVLHTSSILRSIPTLIDFRIQALTLCVSSDYGLLYHEYSPFSLSLHSPSPARWYWISLVVSLFLDYSGATIKLEFFVCILVHVAFRLAGFSADEPPGPRQRK